MSDVYHLLNFGKVIYEPFVYGNCSRKSWYDLNDYPKEFPDIQPALTRLYDNNFDSIPVNDDLKYFQYESIIYETGFHFIEGRLSLSQHVDTYPGFPIYYTSRSKSPFIPPTYYWYPLIHLFFLHLVKGDHYSFDWNIFSSTGETATIRATCLFSDRASFNKGTVTTVNFDSAKKGMSDVSQKLKIDSAPARDHDLYYTLDQHSKMLLNTRKNEPLPQDPSADHLTMPPNNKYNIFKCPEKNHPRIVNHFCKSCPYQKRCWSLKDRYSQTLNKPRL